MTDTAYQSFIESKSHAPAMSGFEPSYLPDWLFDFQVFLLEWSVRKGRGAMLADCGLGKGPMALVWAHNVVRHTNKPVLIITPLAVGAQFLTESEKFQVPDVSRSRDGGDFSAAGIIVTNYEKLHLFAPSDFAGVVCDESSILKHFTGATQKAVTQFLKKVPYRLLCTATAAPNDYAELGCTSEALGELGMVDMLGRFFKQDAKQSGISNAKGGRDKTAGSVISGTGNSWRLKGHAATPFWKWVASWAKACRKPSDLGFDDARFILPELIERDHIIEPKRPKDGMLFTIPAVGLQEEREERRRTLDERCDLVAELVEHDKSAVVWCHLNDEGDRLAKLINQSTQVKGGHSDEQKEEAYRAFQAGDSQARVLVIKPKIGAWGLNWQHCAHVVTFASHSYEQYYQSVRRCWRFGQQSPVTVDIVATEGERAIRENMARKAEAADRMFTELVRHMNESTRLSRAGFDFTNNTEIPSWLS